METEVSSIDSGQPPGGGVMHTVGAEDNVKQKAGRTAAPFFSG